MYKRRNYIPPSHNPNYKFTGSELIDSEEEDSQSPPCILAKSKSETRSRSDTSSDSEDEVEIRYLRDSPRIPKTESGNATKKARRDDTPMPNGNGSRSQKVRKSRSKRPRPSVMFDSDSDSDLDLLGIPP